jgi:putative transposase
MTQPRRVLPGMIVMVTRRTLRRTHLLRPDKELTALYSYLLAIMSLRYGIEVHAAVLMSTHEHLIVTDTRGTLPLFLRELHRVVALGVKVLRKWEGAVWDHEKTSVVELRTPQAVVEKLAYIMANPVNAGLVYHARKWPGLTTRPEELGVGSITAARPEVYLDSDNSLWPERATIGLTTPRLGISREQLEKRVAAELERLERVAHEEIAAKKWRVPCAEVIKRLSPFQRARSWEPLRGRNPHFAVGRKQRKAFFQASLELKTFRTAYRAALELWRTGVRDVVFPAATWMMNVFHGVRVAARSDRTALIGG